MNDSDAAASESMQRHAYASANVLQTYDVLIPGRESGGIWIIYIHGGYFRDPKVDSTSFKPTIELLEGGRMVAGSTTTKIAGYCSVNYRLSAHPAYHQDPSTRPTHLNNARWPDHLDDILAALKHFQQNQPEVKNDYILAGHSVGATLSFLSVLRMPDLNLYTPKCVVGVSGIYDFDALHGWNKDYIDITRCSMDDSQFQQASPAQYPLEKYRQAWSLSPMRVLAAASPEDTLVPIEQDEYIAEVFKGADDVYYETLGVRMDHNEIWQKGIEMAKVIEKAVEMCSWQ